MPRNHPQSRAAGGRTKQSRADPAFPAEEGDFWVQEQEKEEKSKLAHRFLKAGAGGLLGSFFFFSSGCSGKQSRIGQKERKKGKEREEEEEMRKRKRSGDIYKTYTDRNRSV
ncbi:hypothetical protein SLEP1_g15136 [Rubroshorea leprosula]|uniref:Uncharacterized protein n=1 Tax=Rubroshorea leprosula TaxID=152421 RepID=A0AAV5IQQ8_9ROSI|nr:hypothetical protein SLEP1_g15136 [Rubroshorea leprosula]